MFSVHVKLGINLLSYKIIKPTHGENKPWEL